MDKREAARVSVRVPAQCRSRGVVIDGLVEDMSRTGLFLRASELMAAGSTAQIALELPGQATLLLTGEVVRLEHDPQRVGMGLRFVVDGDDSRSLANFLMKQHATRL